MADDSEVARENGRLNTDENAYDGLNGNRKIGPPYTYDTYLICMGLGPSISSVIAKGLAYSGPSYASSPVQATLNSLTCFKQDSHPALCCGDT